MLKLQIDLDTLEKMIGGDTPFHVEIKNGIIQTFARRHLKSLVNTQVMQDIRNEINEKLTEMKAVIEEEAMQVLPVKKNNRYYCTQRYVVDVKHPAYEPLLTRVKEAVRDHSQVYFNNILQEMLAQEREYIESESKILSTKIKAEVEGQLTKRFNAKVNNEIKRRLAVLAKDEKDSMGEEV